MTEDISAQILTQTNENIQKLFNLSSRIDEKVKAVKEQQEDLSKHISEIHRDYNSMIAKVAVLESHSGNGSVGLAKKIESQDKEIVAIDKRLISVESVSDKTVDRWKTIGAFILQLVWIVVAAYLIAAFGLAPPPVP